MVMRPAPTLALAAAFAVAAAAVAAHASTTNTRGSVVIAEPGGIEVISDVLLPAVVAPSRSGGAPSSSSSSRRQNNSSLTIRAQSDSTLSMAVPESFQVIRNGGTEGLTVKTTTDTDLHLARDGVVLGGSEIADGTMSVNVGGLISLASAGAVVPGPYEGTLLVLVQYN